MRFRPYVGLFVVLAVASAACSGSPRGEDGAAPPKSTTTLSSVPGALHDTVPAPFDPADKSGSAPRSRSTSGASGAGTAPTNDTTATTPGGGGGDGTPTTTATTSTTPPPGLPAEKCPEPKTCRRYRFGGGSPARWRIGPDERATIRYRINPSGAVSTITPEQIEGAIAAAMDTWQRTAPTLRFVYEGRTDKVAVNGDGVNVISFNAPETARTFAVVNPNRELVEFDIYFRHSGWVWAPCEQRDGSCTPYRTTDPVTGFYATDLQAVATHEVGHALWLEDMTDDNLDRELTMYPGDAEDLQGSRHWTTLALGDVLGIRALYRTSAPMPTIYEP